MLLAYGLLILGCMGSVSYAQSEVAVPQNTSELHEIVCEEIERIRSDFRFYMLLYKNLSTEIHDKYPNSNFCQELLSEMFSIIKCILDLAKEIEEEKGVLLTSMDNARDIFRRSLEGWVMKVQEKQSNLFRLAQKLREKDSDVSPDLIDRFDTLNIQCIDVVQQGLINLLLGEVEFVIPLLPEDFNLRWRSPIPDICEKVKILKLQCRRMMRKFWLLRNLLKPGSYLDRSSALPLVEVKTHKEMAVWDQIPILLTTRSQKTYGFCLKETAEQQENGLSGPNYPNDELNQLFICIIEYCRCIETIVQLCDKANFLSAEDLERVICQWLMKIKEIRNKLVSYWEDLVEAINERVQETGDDDLIKFWRKKLRVGESLNVIH